MEQTRYVRELDQIADLLHEIDRLRVLVKRSEWVATHCDTAVELDQIADLLHEIDRLRVLVKRSERQMVWVATHCDTAVEVEFDGTDAGLLAAVRRAREGK